MIDDTSAGRIGEDTLMTHQGSTQEPSLFVRHRRSERRHPAQTVTRREARM